ncbi:hypothetical protein BJ138DRAFT_1010739 [Hygrophoropsis aurantiaca]|uniref:Uncharacterized protein n=1 Tax=Hygrophoropsis aurantiaca TaxID=72124 RepID=A0ACB8A8C7_9AGAM|nr:hypothetical protein BJ138DRAFT_1010739 [Hygrophoropsis aurantiaca]
MQNTTPSTTFVRITDLYLNDGNIILFANRDSSTTYVFRLHKSVLAIHSGMFADMFALATPSEDDDIYEGLPVIRMHDDAKDVEAVFRACYYPSSISFPRRHPDTAFKLIHIFPIASKYQFDTLKKSLELKFREDWPITLTEWDALTQEQDDFRYKRPMVSINEENYRLYSPDFHFPEAASAIRLARVADIPEILPAAFYQLYLSSPSDDYDIWRAETPGDSFYEKYKEEWLNGARTVRWSLLTEEDLLSLTHGKEKLSALTEPFRNSFPDDICTSCNIEEDCMDIWNRNFTTEKKDWLSGLQDFSDLDDEGYRCECPDIVRSNGTELREKVWSELSGYFGLEQ